MNVNSLWKLITIVGATALGMSIASSAGATTITQVRDITGETEFGETISDFDQFAGPGTLQSVELSWNISSSGSASADGCLFFDDCDPAVYTLALTGYNAFAGAADSAGQFTGIDVGIDDLQTGSFDVNISGSQFFGNLASFTGAGLVGDVDLSGFWDGYHTPVSGSKSGTLTLTYEYGSVQAVPEPATLSLIGLGLAGAAARRRLKKRA